MLRRSGTDNTVRRGFTLVEAAIVLGVAGLVVGGVWYAASRVQRSAAVNTAGDQLYQIADNVRGIYSARQGIFTENTAVAGCGAANFNSRLSCQGAYPVDMTGGAGNFAFHSWDRGVANGSVQVEPMNNLLNNAFAVAPGVTSFGVRFINLPVDVCIEMAVRHSIPDDRLKLKAVIVRDNAGAISNSYTTTDWGGANALPVGPTVAVAACRNAAGGGNTATLEWVYMLR